MATLLVTGGAGFVGSTFVRFVLDSLLFDRVVTVDALTYAGSLANLESLLTDPRHKFVNADISDSGAVAAVFEQERPTVVVHLAEESHVDRGVLTPATTVRANLHGTLVLLEAARRADVQRFVHLSTYGAYGHLDEPLEADELFPLAPSNAYAASKAAADLLVLAYYQSYGLPSIVLRASNLFGPRQFPEKLISLAICRALDDRPVPIYGDGEHVRNWLFVDDCCRAIGIALAEGRPGEVYNVSGSRSLPNIEVVRRILRLTHRPASLITAVQDRPGHDRRNAHTSLKLRQETGWHPQVEFDDGLTLAVAWYVENRNWTETIRSESFREYFSANYEIRPAALRLTRAVSARSPWEAARPRQVLG
jgi:dTDP-glucose 4,6-dehydratase